MIEALPLPAIIPVSTIAEWLPKIFPEGTPNRTYVIREIAAKTIFTMIYIGAVEGSGCWLRPNQVTKMSDSQSLKTTDKQRGQWGKNSLAPGRMKHVRHAWYATDTREPIRDETLRSGLVTLGAVVEKKGLPTTSSRPRYAVAKDFYELLRLLSFETKGKRALMEAWQRQHLSAAALSRVELLRRGAIQTAAADRIKISFPNGETRLMRPGPSTIISKAVVEEFAARFLHEPGVIFLSESSDQVVERDERLARSMGLKLDFQRNLPDIVLADVSSVAPKLLFIEVVATNGAITEQRMEALTQVSKDAGFPLHDTYFVTAFADRGTPAFRRAVAHLAWNSFVWFAAEPDKLLVLREGVRKELTSLLSY